MRVLLARMSNMEANIVTSALASTPDVEVAGRAASLEELEAEVRRTGADGVLIHGERAGDPEAIERLLRAVPGLRVATIDPSGHRGQLHELRVCAVDLENLSGDLLRRALQGGRLEDPQADRAGGGGDR
jgi:chemotaxis response regulator CheB